MIVLIDNYDSFTYNLVQRLGEIDSKLDIRVFRNNVISPDAIAELKPSHIIISPGPCTPHEAGISCEVAQRFASEIPLLGVCLGHQSIAHIHGGLVVRAKRLMHGKTDLIYHDKSALFEGLDNPFQATRYHSLIVEPGSLPSDFIVCAWSKAPDGSQEIMALRHQHWPIFVVQFDPESFLTLGGTRLLQNFLNSRKQIPQMEESV